VCKALTLVDNVSKQVLSIYWLVLSQNQTPQLSNPSTTSPPSKE